MVLAQLFTVETSWLVCGFEGNGAPLLVEVRGWYPHTHSSPLTLMGMRCRGGEVWAGLWSLWIWVIVSLELSHSLVYDLVLEGTALPTTAARGSLLGSMQMLMPKMPSEMPPGPSAYRVHEIRVLTQVPFPESPVGPQRCLWLVPWFPGASLGWVYLVGHRPSILT